MTEPNGEPDQEPEGTPEPPKDPPQEPADPSDTLAKVRREAAGYRTKLRETEAERDCLVAQVEDHQRAEVERQVTDSGGLASARDFWTAGVKLEELRDEEGALDAEKVKAARDRILAEHPHWAQPSPSFDGGAREPAREDKTPSFGDAIKKAASGQ